MESMLKRRTIWFVVNTLFVIALYLALHQGTAGAVRVAEFYIWTTFVLSLTCLNDDFARDIQTKKVRRCIPAWFDVLIDITIILVLVWHGWIWCAIAYSLQAVFAHSVWRDLPPIAAEQAAK